MKTIRLSAIYQRSLLSLLVAAALLLGSGARAWAQGDGTLLSEPDRLSVRHEDSPPTVEPSAAAALSDAALSSSRPQEASPSPSATPVGATSANGAAPPTASLALTPSVALPVVFVPGTAGSELRLTSSHLNLTDVLYWIGGTTLGKNNLGRAPLDEFGRDREGNRVTAPRALSVFSIPNRLKEKLSQRGTPLLEEEIYSNFLLWAQAVFKGGFYEVPYDWRKGASPESESAARVAAVVDEALRTSGQSKVILLAHSLGGIVARDYIVRSKGEHVAAFIAVGTPWLGAPKTARALLWGYNFGAAIVRPSKKDITVQGDAEDFAGNRYCRPNRDKPGYLCPYPVRISFFKLEETAKLARNFPAVYQQLPTQEFMEKYGAFYGQKFRPVILGMKSWKDIEDFYTSKDELKRGNPFLYEQAQELRKRILRTGNFGVRNYLIAGVYSPACRNPNSATNCNLDNVMDMQMAGREKVKRSFALKMRSMGLRALNLIARPLGFILTREKFVLEEDRYVATDSDVDWGDGTAPLLSATAGEYLKGEEDHRFPGAASDLLGEGTEVETVTLDPPYPHSAMLNDPKIRAKLLRIYSERNKDAGLDPTPGEPGEVITSLKIEFVLTNTPPGSGAHSIRVSFPDGAQEAETALVLGNKAVVNFKNPRVRDTHILIPNVRHDQTPLGVPRSLRVKDCSRVVLNLQKILGGALEFNEYQVTANGKMVFTNKQSFTLKTEPHQLELQCQ